MTEEELHTHITRMENQIRKFRILNPEGAVKGGFGPLKLGGSNFERVRNIELALKQFNLIGDASVHVAGNFDTGYVVSATQQKGLAVGMGAGSTTVIFAGCTNPAAMNYDPTATVDDGTCYFLLFVHLSGNLRMRGNLTLHRGAISISGTLNLSATLSALRLVDLDGELDFSSDLDASITGPLLTGTLTWSGLVDQLRLAAESGTLDLAGSLSEKAVADEGGTESMSGALARILVLGAGNYAAQDFEETILGDITSLPHPASNDIFIGDTVFGDGVIEAAIYNYGAETFETFSTGTISSFGAATVNLGDSSLDATATFIT